MEKAQIESVFVHAVRDVSRGRDWVCACTICVEARTDLELVDQVRSKLQAYRATTEKIESIQKETKAPTTQGKLGEKK